MKKSFFITLLLATFAVYALYIQQSLQNDTNVPVILNKNEIAPPVETSPAFVPPIQNAPPATATVPTPAPAVQLKGAYRDGTYRGTSADAYYGYVQVNAIIQGGKIADVQFLSYPNDRGRSVMINTYAMPRLISEAIQSQSANVNIISGATDTSGAFRQSLASALAQAKN